MSRATRSSRWVRCLTLVLLLAAGLTTRAGAQSPPPAPQTQVPSVRETVTVSAADAARIDRVIGSLARGRDPFIARLADRLSSLALSLARPQPPGEVYTVGPLTDSERAVVDLGGFLSAHATSDGPIPVQILQTWIQPAPEIYRLTPAGLLTMIDAMVRGQGTSSSQTLLIQHLFTERMVLDLNHQAGGVIPRGIVFVALASGFKDRSVGDRLLATVRAMEEDGIAYDLVPASRLDEFRRRAEPGFIVPARSRRQPGAIQVRYGERYYFTHADDLIWSYLRLFAGDNSRDWQVRTDTRKRSTLGRGVIEYLEAQIVGHAIDMLLVATGPPVAVFDGEVLVAEYRSDSPAAAFLTLGPGVVRRTSTRNAAYLSISVRAAELEDFRVWLVQLRQGRAQEW